MAKYWTNNPVTLAPWNEPCNSSKSKRRKNVFRKGNFLGHLQASFLKSVFAVVDGVVVVDVEGVGWGEGGGGHPRNVSQESENWLWRNEEKMTEFTSRRLRGSVTRFGEISPLWQYFKSLDQICNSLFSVWTNFEPALAIILCYWVDFWMK